ncbi:hypothetical protein A2U01_0075961, partial [Trifolium medium]|nr:hypothetical protein [Trifolium medium]
MEDEQEEAKVEGYIEKVEDVHEEAEVEVYDGDAYMKEVGGDDDEEDDMLIQVVEWTYFDPKPNVFSGGSSDKS